MWKERTEKLGFDPSSIAGVRRRCKDGVSSEEMNIARWERAAYKYRSTI